VTPFVTTTDSTAFAVLFTSDLFSHRRTDGIVRVYLALGQRRARVRQREHRGIKVGCAPSGIDGTRAVPIASRYDRGAKLLAEKQGMTKTARRSTDTKCDPVIRSPRLIVPTFLPCLYPTLIAEMSGIHRGSGRVALVGAFHRVLRREQAGVGLRRAPRLNSNDRAQRVQRGRVEQRLKVGGCVVRMVHIRAGNRWQQCFSAEIDAGGLRTNSREIKQVGELWKGKRRPR
jgi:hypothetical protein